MLRRLREIDPSLPLEGMAAVPTEARILDYGERDVVRPGGRPVRRRSVSPEHKRYLVLVVACVLTAASVWAWTQPKASAAPTAGLRFAAAATPAATTGETPSAPASMQTPASTASAPTGLTTKPTVSPTPRSPMAGIYAIGGWVRRVDVPSRVAPGTGPVGPDGKIYLAGTVLDRDGTVVQGVRRANAPQLFGPDGTAYGVDNDQEMATIWATGPDGVPGFAYRLSAQEPVDLRMSRGSLLATYPVVAEGEQFTQVLQLDLSGTVLENWRMPGFVPTVEGRRQLFIRPNGNLLAQVSRADACSLGVFTPAGWLVSSSDCWQSITQGFDGTLVGWSCLQVEAGTCIRSSVAVLNEDGSVAKGWPKAYEANTSLPAVGPQGIFFVVSPGPSDTTAILNGGILAFSRAGEPLEGWPAPLDINLGTRVFDGCTCSLLPSVVVGGRSELVVLETQENVLAWHPAGRIITSWWVNGPEAPQGAPILAETGDVVFVASSDRIQALKPDASTGIDAQFVDRGADKVSWLGWQLTPDGGLVAFAYHVNPDESYVIVARLDVSE